VWDQDVFWIKHIPILLKGFEELTDVLIQEKKKTTQLVFVINLFLLNDPFSRFDPIQLLLNNRSMA